MQKKLLITLILLLLFSNCVVRCITCEYPDNDLIITYDEDNNFSVDSSFINSATARRLYTFIMQGGGEYEDLSGVERPKNLAEKYKGKACPGKMWICEVSKSYTSVGIRSLIIERKILTVGERKLYILTDEDYKTSSIRKYEGGYQTTQWEEDYEKGFDDCGGNTNWYFLSFIPQAWGTVCSGVKDTGTSIGSFVGGEDGYRPTIIYNTDCHLGHYNGPYTEFNVNCNDLSSELYTYSNAIISYKKCDSEDNACKSKVINKLNTSEDNLKSICKSYYSRYDFNEPQSPCLNTCLQLKTKLNEMRQGTDLYEDYSNMDDTCGMSKNIISMIYNVLKWAKYISPVLVIILSILDFIKALAAQNDDDMKKAQGKFVKRLIVASLLFLIPLIINFTLKTFGFYHSGCDITDLF